MAAALRLEGVSKRYGDFEAVRDLSFEASPGRILGFLGPNGAGKTSTVRMILGLSRPTDGAITVLGVGDARKVRDRIGFLPEERGLYRRMTPVDAIAFFSQLKGMPRAKARRRAEAMLEAQGLGEAMRRPIKALSKGMAQKVQLLAALAHEPELVILDEPFAGLDPVNQMSLEAILKSLAAHGATVVFSTHVMEQAERLCDQVVLIARGRKVFDGGLFEARSAAPRTLLLEGAVTAADALALPDNSRGCNQAGELLFSHVLHGGLDGEHDVVSAGGRRFALHFHNPPLRVDDHATHTVIACEQVVVIGLDAALAHGVAELDLAVDEDRFHLWIAFEASCHVAHRRPRGPVAGHVAGLILALAGLVEPLPALHKAIGEAIWIDPHFGLELERPDDAAEIFA